MNVNKINGIIGHIRDLYKLSEIIIEYSKDPREGLSKLDLFANTNSNINKDDVRNISTGMISEITYGHAVSLGRSLLKDIMSKHIKTVEEDLNSIDQNLNDFIKTINNDIVAFNTYFAIGLPDVQLTDLKHDPMNLKQKYFLHLLETQFLPRFNTFGNGLEYKLALSNIVSIIKERLDVIETKTPNSLNQDIENVKNIFEYVKDAVKESEDLIPMETKEVLPIEAKLIKYEIPGINVIGKRMNDLAKDTKSIDQDVDILSGLYCLPERFTKTITPLLNRYKQFKEEISKFREIISVPRINSIQTLYKISDEYIDVTTLEKDFIVKVTNCINVLIRSIDASAFIYNKVIEVYQDLHKDILDYVIIYNVFSDMVRYSLKSDNVEKDNKNMQ